LFLSLADHLATEGPKLDDDNWKIHTQIVKYILSQRNQMPSPEHWLIDGYDIMNRFNLKPGRRVGELLEIVHEAQASGQVSTKDEALVLLKQILNRPAGARDQDAGGD
jgi:poly(A) polymerase